VKELRPYQVEGIAKLRYALSSKDPRTGARYRRPVLQIPTGGGKTLIAATIIRSAIAKRQAGEGAVVVFCCPRLSLINQTVEAFVAEGITDIGVIQANHPLTNPRASVQVASRQTLQRRSLPETGFVIVDECHDGPDFYRQWVAERPDLIFIGLSATPWTKGLGNIFDCLIQIVSTAELIEQGYLCPFRVLAPQEAERKADLSKVGDVAGEYNQGQLSDAMSTDYLVADVVKTWLERGEDRPTFCFCVDRAHARHLEERFAKNGVSVAYIDANTPVMEREEIGRRFHAGDVKVVCNVGVLTTGIDWDVRCLILARPTKSEMLYVQMIGRALRTAPGKDHALILDHSTTTERLGLVTDIDHDRLDDGKPRSKSEGQPEMRLPVSCPECSHLRPANMSPCPVCGHIPRPKRKDYTTLDGELVEVRPDKTRVEGLAEKRSFYGQLKAIGLERGRQPGWAAHNYREKFGCWPEPGVKYVEPQEPSQAVRNWVRSRQIAFAKGRARAEDAYARSAFNSARFDRF
jgi:superfamily II DNA or RNA helicase